MSGSYENLELCYYCNEKIENYMTKCAYCGRKFCDTHRLSENHECLAQIVTDVKKYLIMQYQKLDIIEGEPQEAFFRRAEIFATIKRPGITIKLSEYIVDNFPDAHEAIFLAATQYEKLKNYRQALNFYREACEIELSNKQYDRSYNLLAGKVVLEFKKRFRTAKRSFDTLEEKDQELILEHHAYDDLAFLIDDLYTPPRLKKMLANMKNRVAKTILTIPQQVEFIRGKFSMEPVSEGSTKYSVDLGNGHAVLIDLKNYPKIPEFEFPVYMEEQFNIEKLAERLYTLRTWSETQPYNLTDVIIELKACLGFYGIGKIQISQQFSNLAKQTAKEHAPNEFGAFIQLDRWVIWRLRMPQKYYSTPFVTMYYTDQIPFMDTSVVGFIHSHTLGPPDPSDQDRITFKMYYINMILGSTKKESSLDQLIVYDREGKMREWEVTHLIEDDVFPIEEKENKDFKDDIYL
ncbi:MAG: AN1-type zinc finger domain-containing protein [Promethearchaeota archaeon]